MSKIMIAVDNSSYAAGVIAAGMELARTTKSEVVLLSVIDTVSEVVPVAESGTDAAAFTSHLNLTAATLEQFKLGYPDVPTGISAIIGEPKKEILEQARDQAATTLVIGTHGRTGLDHLLVGSTAEFVIRHAHIPVLVVPYKQIRN
jgi:nucleotide-binding universal stress UspA family protein